MLAKTFFVGIACLGGLLLHSEPGFAQTTTFRWKLRPGLRFTADITRESEQGTEPSGKPVTQKLTLQETWSIDSVSPASVASVVTVLDRVTMKMDLGAGAVEFDTHGPEADDSGMSKQFGQLFRLMIGQPCTNEMLASGKCNHITLPPQALDAFKKQPTGKSVESLLLETFESRSPTFPETPIAPGQTWEQVSRTKKPEGTVEATTTFTYVGAKSFDGRILHEFSTDTKMKFVGQAPLGAKAEITRQSNKGILLFDQENGYMVLNEMDQDISMTIEFASGPAVQNYFKQKMKTVLTPFTNPPSK